MDGYFTRDKIRELTTKFNWVMVPDVYDDGWYRLCQKGNDSMKTAAFRADADTVNEFVKPTNS